MLAFIRITRYAITRLVFALLVSLPFMVEVQAQTATGTLTTNSPCYLPGPESISRCTINLSITKQNTPITCVWNTNPSQLDSCQGHSSWSTPWGWATTTPRTLELRAYNFWPGNTEAGRQAGTLLAQKTVVAKLPTGTLTTSSPCFLPGPESASLCTVTLNVTRQNVPISCLWIINPISVIHCGPLASWSQPWAYTSTTPRVIELRGHATYPESNAAGHAEGILLAQRTVAAQLPTGTLTTNSPCSLPGPESASRCTVTLNVTKQNVPISCLWITNPASAIHCGPLASWSQPWAHTSTTPRVIELRGHATYPTSNEAGRAAGVLLAQRTVVATSAPSSSSSSSTPPISSSLSSVISSSSSTTTTSSSSSSAPGTPSVPTPPTPVLASVPAVSSTIDQARALPGEFAVTSGGQASYKVPVLASPGSAGMAPNVSVSYNSGAGNGPIGLGWSLNAGGSVSRCRQTEGQDKNAAPISWSSEDRFCLNGQRLMVDSGFTYGAPNSRYKLEVDDFSRITAIGGASGTPDHFKVEHKDGRVDYYGLEDVSGERSKYRLDANKVLSWMLSASEDSAGNKIRYNYLIDSEEYSLNPTIRTIDYAFDSSGNNPAAQLVFYWQSRSDITQSFIGGKLSYSTDRLRKIESKNNNQQIREYRFTYDQIPSSSLQDNLSRLDSIQECVNSICRNATSFDWSVPDISGFRPNSGTFSLDEYHGGYTPIAVHEMADMNGDGLMDLIWIYRGSTELRYAVASSDTNGNITYTEQNFENNGVVNLRYYNVDGPKISFTDYNNDGREDLLIHQLPAPTQISIYLSKPQLDGTWKFSSSPVETFANTWGELLVADLNADGLKDIMNFKTRKARFLRPNGAGYGSEKVVNIVVPSHLNSTSCPGGSIQNLRHETGDFNGDGRIDFIAIACVPGPSNTVRYEQHIYTSHGKNDGSLELRFLSKLSDTQSIRPIIVGSCDQFTPGVEYDHDAAGPIRVLDLNNDGLSDVVGGDFDCSINHYRLNTGVGFGPKTGLPPSYHSGDGLWFADLNQDGYPDLIGSTVDGSDFKVRHWSTQFNRFSTTERLVPIQHPMVYQDNVRFQDLNGDGVVDYFSARRDRLSPYPNQHVQLGSSNPAGNNKIKSITDGLGHLTNISYQRLNNTRHYGGLIGVNSSSTSESICQNTDAGNTCWSRRRMANSSADFYQHINNPFGEFPDEEQRLSDAPFYAVFNVIGPMYVVTETKQSSPGTVSSQPGNVNASGKEIFNYYYDEARAQAAGIGFLGFKRFTKVNRQTGVRQVTEYRQDWPFIGQPTTKEIFGTNNHLLGRTEYYRGFAECYSHLTQVNGCTSALGSTAMENGTKAIAAIKPFLAKEKAFTYHLNSDGGGGLAKIVETDRAVDQHGNMVFESVSTGLGGSPLHVVETANTYSYPTFSYSGSKGRLSNKRVESSQYGVLGGSSITRESSFGYYQSGSAIGLLEFEIIEPNNAEFEVRTSHYYNSLGLRTESRTVADGQTRRKEVEYDVRGRYVDKTYELFTNGTSHDAGLRRLTSYVASRDKYGTPTQTRHYVSSTNYVTSTAATTPFGTTYFTADGSGTFTHLDAGIGSGPGNVCPSSGKIWQKTSVAGGSASITCTDLAGRTVREAVQGFAAGTWSATDYEYNRSGQLIHKSEPRFLSETARWTSNLDLDALGRPSRILAPIREQDGIRPATDIQYEEAFTSITNPNDQTRVEEKNLLGQVASVKDPVNGYTYFTYDARGNMKSMRDPNGNTTTVGYDLRDRKTTMVDPDKGSWSYEYNRFNELTCQKDAKNQAVFHKYDIRGRLVTRIDRKGTSSCTLGTVEKTTNWLYDTATNGLGKLARVYSVVSSTIDYDQSYTLDNLGRNTITTTKLQGHNNVVETSYEKTTYDQFGRVFQIFDAARITSSFTQNGVQHVYGTTGYMQEVKDAVVYGGQQKTYYAIGNMDARGNVTAATYGNGVTKSASYYKDSGLARVLATHSAAPAVALQYNSLNWDQVGNLQSRRETGGGTWIEQYLRSRNIQETFEYDDLNRLERWVTAGDFSSTESVTYDAIDNIRTKTGVGSYLYGNQCTHVSNAGPHAICRAGTTNYTYDDNGNLTSDGSGRSLQYTAHDLPSYIAKGSHITRFSYGPSGGRYKRVDQVLSSVTTTLYLGNVEKIFYPNNTREWKRTIAGAAIVTQALTRLNVVQTTKEHYLHYDHLGSVSMITDASGRVARDFYFDPWGASRKPNSGLTQWIGEQPFIKSTKPFTSRGFTGHEHLDEVGFIHMNGRIYDAKLARFIQADPIIQDPLKVQSLNRYSYVWNNPLNSTDPSGFVRSAGMNMDSSDEIEYVGKTPDMDLDGSTDGDSLFDLESQMEQYEVTQALDQTFKGENSTSNSVEGVTVEEITPSISQTTQTSSGNNSAASIEILYPDVPEPPCETCPREQTTYSSRSLGDMFFDAMNSIPPQWGPGEVKLGIAAVGGLRAALNTSVAGADDVARGLAGLSRSQTKVALQTAQEAYKGTTRAGHALSKHAGRNPDIWGQVTGSQKTWNNQAMKHMREVFRGPGGFQKVANDKGITFLEKRLSDGRGIRLNQDHTFKGFID